MRTSCDIDILVREQDIDTAAQAIGEKLGYRYESKNYHDISLKSESGVHLELHFSLKENEENIDGLLSDCWQLHPRIFPLSSVRARLLSFFARRMRSADLFGYSYSGALDALRPGKTGWAP